MIGRAGQWARGDEQEAPRLALGAEIVELLRRDEAVDGGMLAGRLEILADGEEIDVRRAEIVHQRKHLGLGLAEADHDAGFGEDARLELLGALEQAQRVVVARAWADLPVERRHGLEIVVEHVRPRRHHHLERAVLAQEIGRQHLDGRRRRLLR